MISAGYQNPLHGGDPASKTALPAITTPRSSQISAKSTTPGAILVDYLSTGVPSRPTRQRRPCSMTYRSIPSGRYRLLPSGVIRCSCAEGGRAAPPTTRPWVGGVEPDDADLEAALRREVME